MVTFDPKLNNPFANYGINNVNPVSTVATSYKPQEVAEKSGYENYGTGKGVNGVNSNGVIGEVTGTGENGVHKLNMYM